MTFNLVSRIPDSPFLNENWYLVWGTDGATFTGAFSSVGSVVAPIRASGASYISFYPAGSVATGTYAIYGFHVKGNTGTFTNSPSITIRNSDIAEPVATVYSIIKNNIGSTYATALVTTGWYDRTATRPQITVTSARRTDETFNLNDTFRLHEETVYVDTWVGTRDTGASLFGTTSKKRSRKLLDDEVKRIINANRKAPSAKLRHMQIVDAQPLDEVTDNRRMFRTRMTVRIAWDETVS